MSLLDPTLEAFLAIVRNSTVHGAAKDLGLTQTGVTQRIRALEKKLRTTLFLRSRKGMKLTQEGEALLRYCKGTEELSGLILGQIKEGGKKGPVEVTIAGPTSVMTSRITDQCIKLYSEWPELNLNLLVSDLGNEVNLVRSNQATFAITSPDLVPNEMDSKMLKPEKYILVASFKWKKRRLQEILNSERIIDFYNEDSTTMNYFKKFQLSSKGRPRLFVNQNEAIIKLFIAGVGFGTLTQETARPFLESGALITLNGAASLDHPLALTWYPRPEMPSYFKSIVQSIK